MRGRKPDVTFVTVHEPAESQSEECYWSDDEVQPAGELSNTAATQVSLHSKQA